MAQGRPDSERVRLAELMATLSLATDLGMGQPLSFALSSCLLALRLGEALGLSEKELHDVYYQALLRYIGCNAETATLAAIAGDELTLRANYATVDPGHQTELIGLLARTIRQTHAGASPLELARLVTRGLLSAGQIAATYAGHCEVAQRLATRLGFDQQIVAALGQLYERWDGKGLPNGLAGEAVARTVRIVTVAQDMITFHRLGGVEAAVSTAGERSGTAYDPAVVACFCRHADSMLADLEGEHDWTTTIDLEPGERRVLSGEALDGAFRAMADFADLKSSFTLTHSAGVAELAGAAARQCGLPERDAAQLRRAGYVHDIGRVGVSAGIWEKPGPLNAREWDQIRLHPYYTERVFARAPSLSALGTLAASNHERLDGSGYHRGLPASLLSPSARILAAADVYHAMTEPRPHRPALGAERAASELQREVRAGRIDGEAAHAVLAVAGHPVRRGSREMVAGLSVREIEVLRLLARGQSTRQIADTLFVAPKTADNHIQHIYAKTGVSTRAGATLFAMEQGLLAGDPK